MDHTTGQAHKSKVQNDMEGDIFAQTLYIRGRPQAAALRRGTDYVFERVIVFGAMLKVQPMLPEFHYLVLSSFVAGNICLYCVCSTIRIPNTTTFFQSLRLSAYPIMTMSQ